MATTAAPRRWMRLATPGRLDGRMLLGIALVAVSLAGGLNDLRHSCASLLLAQGVHPRVVMETLGHSQIALTMNLYSHVIPSLQREAAAKMDEVLAR